MKNICNLDTNNKIIIIIILSIISFVFIVYLVPLLISLNWFGVTLLKKFHYGCEVTCDHPICKNIIKNGRSSSYFINTMVPEKNPENVEQRTIYQEKCVLSYWGISHFILFMIFGMIAPSFFVPTLIFGILFEILEHYVWDCGDILDVAWNSLGFLTGMCIHKHLICTKN